MELRVLQLGNYLRRPFRGVLRGWAPSVVVVPLLSIRIGKNLPVDGCTAGIDFRDAGAMLGSQAWWADGRLRAADGFAENCRH